MDLSLSGPPFLTLHKLVFGKICLQLTTFCFAWSDNSFLNNDKQLFCSFIDFSKAFGYVVKEYFMVQVNQVWYQG